ncbi:MAG: ISNCY family transposase [Oligoflexales bacterium]|nr:ISNCY family transposase [Oligoflexales bacterium]
MRKVYNEQRPLFCQWPDHIISNELKKISAILDSNPSFLELVGSDLQKGKTTKTTGARGMSAEQVLRAAILKQQNQWTYNFLELQCVDSEMTKSFLKLGFGESYSDSCLQENISRIRGETWAKINDAIVHYASQEGLENGRTIRLDATVIESNIHSPSDSTLLLDCFRVADRCFKDLRRKTKRKVHLPLSLKEAKSLLLKIQYGRGKDGRENHYRTLVRYGSMLLKMLPEVKGWLEAAGSKRVRVVENLIDLMPAILDQTRRRVLKGETVESYEKVVSIFEPHTDIIIKGSRDIEYGHKVFLTAGASGLVTHCQLVQGNPSDSEFFTELLEKQITLYGKAPRQLAADGGFASEDNVDDAKEMGVKDVCFSKAPGIAREEMVKSAWVYQKLRNFRAGIEGIISVLKRGFGLERVTWKGVSGFASYVHSGVVAYNLTLLSRLKA